MGVAFVRPFGRVGEGGFVEKRRRGAAYFGGIIPSHGILDGVLHCIQAVCVWLTKSNCGWVVARTQLVMVLNVRERNLHVGYSKKSGRKVKKSREGLHAIFARL